MLYPIASIFGTNLATTWLLGGTIVFLLLTIVFMWALVHYGALWLQAYVSKADVALADLIGMTFRGVDPGMIVTAQVMVRQAGWNIDRREGISTARLEAHYLAGGNVMQVTRAIISARLAGMDLAFDRAAAIDLAGRDVMEAVRISVSPKVINCPESNSSAHRMLSAVAKNGIELRVRARVTVRTSLDRLIGGATEETIIARVSQGIISTIGCAVTHMDVMANPHRISQSVLERGLDSNTAYEIVSIDIADIDVGQNIGARLQIDQAEADMRIAGAQAEVRRAAAVALQQEMKAKVAGNQAALILAEAELPAAISSAFRAGHFQVRRLLQPGRSRLRDRRHSNPAVDQTTSPRPPHPEQHVTRVSLTKAKERQQ